MRVGQREWVVLLWCVLESVEELVVASFVHPGEAVELWVILELDWGGHVTPPVLPKRVEQLYSAIVCVVGVGLQFPVSPRDDIQLWVVILEFGCGGCVTPPVLPVHAEQLGWSATVFVEGLCVPFPGWLGNDVQYWVVVVVVLAPVSCLWVTTMMGVGVVPGPGFGLMVQVSVTELDPPPCLASLLPELPSYL